MGYSIGDLLSDIYDLTAGQVVTPGRSLKRATELGSGLNNSGILDTGIGDLFSGTGDDAVESATDADFNDWKRKKLLLRQWDQEDTKSNFQNMKSQYEQILGTQKQLEREMIELAIPFMREKMEFEGQNKLDLQGLITSGLLQRSEIQAANNVDVQNLVNEANINLQKLKGENALALGKQSGEFGLENTRLLGQNALNLADVNNASAERVADKELARLRDSDKFNLYANLFNGLGNFAFRG